MRRAAGLHHPALETEQMELKDLTDLRPAETTTAAITASVDRIDATIADLEAKAAQLVEKRAAALLSAGTKEILGIEAEQAVVCVDIERLQVLRGSVVGGLDAARQDEFRAAKVSERAAAIELTTSLETWLAEVYPGLAAKVRHGLELERAAEDARRRYSQAIDSTETLAALGVDRVPDDLRLPPRAIILGQSEADYFPRQLKDFGTPGVVTTPAAMEEAKPAPLRHAVDNGFPSDSRTVHGLWVRRPGTPAGSLHPMGRLPADPEDGVGHAA